MGCVSNITNVKFPKQGDYLNKRCRVHFHYDTNISHYGTVIRDDIESTDPQSNLPPITIIQLDDGRVILSTECQYAPFL